MNTKKNIIGIKKILVILFLIFSFVLPIYVYWGECSVTVKNIDETNDIWVSLDTCLGGSKLVDGNGWFWDKVNTWTMNLAKVFWVLAVWSIVYGALLLVVSTWEEEKIKKAKDIIKWWIIGFLLIIAASTVIALVVNIMYSLESV